MELIEKTVEYVKNTLYNDASGHDWWHVYRVWKTAITISKNFDLVDNIVIELSALLHDIADWKENNGDFSVGPKVTRDWLNRFDSITSDQIEHICYIIENMSFKGSTSEKLKLSIEGQIVQDADRLDAMGAIGIARTFAYGGKKKQKIYDPNILPINYESELSYTKRHDESPSINHFYEKLLLLKEIMNTEFARKLAEGRHEFMEKYLEQFYAEWEGEK